MTQEQKRIKIAEACGYEKREDGRWREKGRVGECGIPDYFGCLNACHKMEKHCLTNGKLEEAYYFALDRNHCATAAERAEALGLALGLWTL